MQKNEFEDYKISIPANGMNLARSVSCAQAFRWRSQGEAWFGVASDKAVFIKQEGETLHLSCDESDLTFWTKYFAIDEDYSNVEKMLAMDEMTAPCLETSSGIRVFRQQPFETLISFIISANNNFKRICGLVEKVALHYGDEHEHAQEVYSAFPNPEQLARATQDELTKLGAGYRAPYIVSTARRIANGYDLESLKKLDFAQAKKELTSFLGVGPKVAECAMLFSLGFDEAFPIDVWMARVAQHLCPGMEGKEAALTLAKRYGNCAGAAQQYLFHYARLTGLGAKSA